VPPPSLGGAGRQPDGARAPGLGARRPGHDQQDEPPGERSAPQLRREPRRALTAAEDRLRPPGMEPSFRRARRDAGARHQRQPSPSRSAAPRETAVMTAPACSTSSTTPAGMTPGPASGIVKFVQVSPVAPERTRLSVLAPSRLTMAAKSPFESRARGWPFTARLTLEALRPTDPETVAVPSATTIGPSSSNCGAAVRPLGAAPRASVTARRAAVAWLMPAKGPVARKTCAAIQTSAIASISTFAPEGRAETSIVARAGGCSPTWRA